MTDKQADKLTEIYKNGQLSFLFFLFLIPELQVLWKFIIKKKKNDFEIH